HGALQLVEAYAESEGLFDALAMPLIAAEQADQHVGAGPLPDVGGAAFRAVVLAVLELVGAGIDGDRVGRQDFVADRVGQGSRVHREAARGRRYVLRRTGPDDGRQGWWCGNRVSGH